MARKRKQPAEPERPRKVRPCRICNDAGVVRVWKREPLTGKFFWFDEVCACQGR